MYRKIGLCAILFYSLQTQAVVQDFTYGDYEGTAGGMAGISLSTINEDQRLSLSCYDSKFIITYATLDKNYLPTYEVNSEEGLDDMIILIDNKSYNPSNSDLFDKRTPPAKQLFDALKSTKGTEKVVFSSTQSGESVSFSTKGLNEALDIYSYEDCINWFN